MKRSPTYTLCYLGGWKVAVDGEAVRVRTRRTAALLTYLTVSGRRHGRDELAAFLWDDESGLTAPGNLRVLLSNLRRDVGPLLVIDRHDVGVAPDADVRLDVHRFEDTAGKALAAVRRGDSDATEAIQLATECYTGDFLAGADFRASAAFELWVESERFRLRQLACEVVDHLVDAALDDPAVGDPVHIARRLVALDPTRERSAAGLVRAIAESSGPSEALRELERHEEFVRRELGVDPGPALVELRQQLRSGWRPAFPVRRAPTQAPPTVGRLLGREHEMRELSELLRAGERLVTLVGPAGVGKTAVAAELTRRLAEAGELPVSWIDLTSLNQGSLLAAKLVTDLGIVRREGDDAEASLIRGLGSQSCILVLDNLEHLFGAGAVLGRLLERSPRLVVVATSRVPLRLADERTVVIRSLAVPPDDGTIAARDAPSVELLFERAAAAGVTLGDDQVADAARLCALLDGLPLAIELAAARLRTFSLSEMVGLLAAGDPGRLDVLGEGPADAPQRHSSLTAALDWSYGLLTEIGRAVLRSVSVFDGPFDLPAAIAVSGATWATDIAGALAELVDVNLVHAETSPEGTRYSLLMVVRSHARTKLAESGELPPAQHRLVDHVLALARRARSGLTSADALNWKARLANDLPNVRAALDAPGISDAEALALLCDLGPFWVESPDPGETAQRFSGYLASAPSAVATTVALEARLWMAVLQHDAQRVDRDTVASLLDDAIDALDGQLGDDARTGWELRCRCLVVELLMRVADHGRAEGVAASSLEAADAAGEEWWWVELAYQRAMLAQLQADDDAAVELLRVVIPASEALGNRRVHLYAWMLATLIDRAQDMGREQPALEELLVEAKALEDHRYTVWIQVSLGTFALLEGRLDDGRRWFEEALGLAQSSGYRVGAGFAVMGAVGLAGFQGEPALALELHGGIESQLPSLRQVMPHTFYEAYAELVEQLQRDVRQDPDALDRIEIGRRSGWDHTVGLARRVLQASSADGQSPETRA